MAEIHDFGEKIGGARKDVWRSRGLTLDDLDEMNDAERQDYIKKDNVWPKPNWEKVIASGTPQVVAYWQNHIRKSIPPKPPQLSQEAQDNYVEVVSTIKDAVMAIKEPSEIDTFYRGFLAPRYVHARERSWYVDIDPIASGIVTNKVLKAAQTNSRQMQKKAEKELFGVPKDQRIYVNLKSRLKAYEYDGDKVSLSEYSDDRNCLAVASAGGKSFYYFDKQGPYQNIEDWRPGTFIVLDEGSRKLITINLESRQAAQDYIENFARAAQEAQSEVKNNKDQDAGEKSGRKKGFVPKQLAGIKREGPDYRDGFHADGNRYMRDLKFRAGEFGNWLSDNDRQASLDMGYDAFRDLARILNIRPEDVSLGGTLAIAFGARGRGGANAGSAHFEPARNVINLTKMSGAGCLAHEWGHALDHAIYAAYGRSDYPGFASDNFRKTGMFPHSVVDVMDSLLWKNVTVQPSEAEKELQQEIERSKKNIIAWLNSVKPRSMTEKQATAWENGVESLLVNASSVTGSEYFRFRRTDSVTTIPEIEALSGICKEATRHGIPLDTKRNIALWVQQLGGQQAKTHKLKPEERQVFTDFYKGSQEFDKIHSRAGHGYWQSECEMFARAFDCYISDKLKESGFKSQYLTAYADSFVTRNDMGKPVYAIPTGDERKLINEKFDLMISDLKQRGILHDFQEKTTVIEDKKSSGQNITRKVNQNTRKDISFQPEKSEQLSFDDLLFGAASRAGKRSDDNDRFSREAYIR